MRKTTKQEKQSLKDCLVAISERKELRQEVAELIYDTFNIMNNYGKPIESLRSYTKGFLVSLEDYNIMELRNAFKHYWKTGTGLPEPRDIINIIEDAKRKEAKKPVLHDIEEEKKLQEAWANGLPY